MQRPNTLVPAASPGSVTGIVLVAACLSALLPCAGFAQANERGTLNFVLENDIISGSDRNYTNGFQIDYLSAARGPGSLAAALLGWLPGNDGGDTRWGWQLGQQIYTPRNTDATELLPDQRPYAAWLYGGLSAIYSTDNHIDSWSLSVGTVGPDALGEEIQNGVHDLINSDNSRGWDNQIDNEIGYSLIVERKWRALELMSSEGGFGIDFLPHIGLSLGNVQQYANAGLTFRFGSDLDNDFGPPRIRPSLPGTGYFVPRDGWGWYLFLGLDGRYVDKSIFLDDHDDADLWNIEKKDWVGDAQAGIVLTWREVRFSYTHVYRTEQFDQQLDADRFGSLAVTFRF